MDEIENANTVNEAANTVNAGQESTGSQASEAAQKLKAEAQETLQQLKGGGIMSIFNFDKMFFPIIGRVLFTVATILMIVFGLIMMVAGFTEGIGPGIGGLIGIPLMMFLMWVYLRIVFEVLMVAFKINEGIQEMNRKMK